VGNTHLLSCTKIRDMHTSTMGEKNRTERKIAQRDGGKQQQKTFLYCTYSMLLTVENSHKMDGVAIKVGYCTVEVINII
jgi:hypothetical protein